MNLRVFTVDAFTPQPFTGNPAAVILLEEKIPDDLMQKIASEMNLSETAFLEPKDLAPPDCWSSGKRFGLRWMTPVLEVKLCGHATLSSAQVIFSELDNTSPELEFETLSGVLTARRNGKEICLDFPLQSPFSIGTDNMEVCRPLLMETVGNLEVEEMLLSVVAQKLLIYLATKYTKLDLESLNPNIENLMRIHDGSLVMGIIVTLKGEIEERSSTRGISNHHFISRYFDAWTGYPEDPVTGSAHCVLGPYWSKKLNTKNLKCNSKWWSPYWKFFLDDSEKKINKVHPYFFKSSF